MYQKGFTLIELMVSVTIFIVVMTISLGALLAMSASDRRAEAVKTVMNNLNFALDSMTRTIRTGSNYSCTGGTPDCTSGSGSYRFSFTSATQVPTTYCLGSGTSCTTSTSCPAGCTILRQVNGGAFEAMTAPEVKIYNMSFYLQGSSVTDNTQPRVSLTINGAVATADVTSTAFQLQTSMTQRIYDQ